ncbi:MAG TPA: hypothetical protein PKD49_03085 [Hyphomicrobium sp.]|nr:hypothetical protein [Hyphomicrobium sp.]
MAMVKHTKDGRRPFRRAARQGRGGRLLVRPAIDALAALAFFVAVSMALSCAPSSANPHNPGPAAQFRSMVAPAVGDPAEEPTIVEIATASSPEAPDAVYRRTSFGAAWVLLSFAFSILVAFNLAFLRHMRRVYAKSRPPRHPGSSSRPRTGN